jgi:signal transduction histidine kinase
MAAPTLARNNALYLLLVAAVLLLPLLAGAFIYQGEMTRRLNDLKQEHDALLGTALAVFHGRLGDMRHTIRLLEHDRQLNAALRREPIDALAAQDVMRSYSEVVNDLLQVRWLDATGMERVRIDVVDQAGRTVGAQGLQDKSQRYYFRAGMAASAEEAYLSPIDLNVEHGKVVVPHQPTMRVSRRTGDDEWLLPGLLVLNYNIASLLDSLRQLSQGHVELMVVNPRGYWMLNSDRGKEWGEQLGRPQNTLAEISPALWRALQANARQSGIFRDGVVSSQPLHLRQQSAVADGYLLARTSPPQLASLRADALRLALVTGGLLLLFGLAVLYRDLTQRRAMRSLNVQLAGDKYSLERASERQRELLNQQQLLQQDLVQASRLSSLGMMVAGVAHELNTPIGGAMLAAARQAQQLESLQQAFETGLSRQALEDFLTDGRQGLGLIRTNLSRCASLVTSFKRMAIDRGNEEIVEFAPRQVAEDLLTSLRPQLRQYALVVENRIPQALSLRGYPGVLSQVLQNLVTNALQHGFEVRDQGTITLSAEEKGGSLWLWVRDTGRGIPAEMLPRIFDPFVTSDRASGNTGLGLHFVHQWVTQVLQGTIGVQSPSGQGHGTVFTLVIPLVIESVDV